MRKSFLLVVVCVALVLGAQSQEDKYADIVGDYEFDMEGQVMLVSFWVEEGKLWGGPEGQEAAVLEPVEGKPYNFEVHTPDGQVMEMEFVKDEAGKVVKCLVSMMGMDMEGIKIKK